MFKEERMLPNIRIITLHKTHCTTWCI